MSKLDKLRAAGAANVAESTGGPRVHLPVPGMEGAAAIKMPAHLVGVVKEKDAARIPVDRIERDPEQPREEFDEEALGRLAESLRTRGQLQPIRVRWDESRGVYVVLVGERRWRAAKLAGISELVCLIHQGTLTPDERLAIQLTENALREDLKPIEQAKAYRALIEARGLSQRQLAEELHVSAGTVNKALALLELPAPVQEMVEAGELTPTAAYEISKAHPADQAELVDRAVREGLGTKEVSETVKRSVPKKRSRPTTRVIRTKAGPRVTVEWGRGLDDATVLRALEEAIAKLKSGG